MAPQEITKEQLDAIRADCTPNVSMAARQVPGGYIVTGQVQWVKDGVVQAVQQDEAVCTTPELLASLVQRYNTYHNLNFQ